MSSDDFVEHFSRTAPQDRTFDIAFWQKAGPEARFEAAWELVLAAHKLKNKGADELRLERTVENFQRSRG